MKRTILGVILACEFILLIVLFAIVKDTAGSIPSIVAYPFTLLSTGLLSLSELGQLGNAFATVLWVCISLIPCIIAFLYTKGRTALPERIVLILLSAVLFFVIYGAANPHLIAPVELIENADTVTVRAAAAISVWSILILFIILRLIRLFNAGNKQQLIKYLNLILCVLSIFYTASMVYIPATGFATSSQPGVTSADRLISSLKIIINALPYALDIAVIFAALGFLEKTMAADKSDIEKSIQKLNFICGLALALISASIAVLNILQTLLARNLSSVSAELSFPLDSLIFVAVILLLSRLISENRRLREDNELFI